MGVKSTYKISRETAIVVIVSKLSNLTDEQLAIMLEAFDESYYRNYIVSDTDDLLSDERSIQNLSEFLYK